MELDLEQAPTGDSIPLSALAPGETGSIVRVGLHGPERRALLDLGFVPDTVVECVFQSPLGDPTAFRLRSTVVALRRSQSDAIEVIRCSL